MPLVNFAGQNYELNRTVEHRASVLCHQLTDGQGRQYRLLGTRENSGLDSLGQQLERFAKIRHYHLSPLVAWQPSVDGFEWLFLEPDGENVECLLGQGMMRPKVVERFIDNALTLYGAFEAHQWLPQNFHPRNLWLDSGGELILLEELEFRVEMELRMRHPHGQEDFPLICMSPEEVQDPWKNSWGNVEFRIGIIAYLLLTGQHPFGASINGIYKLMTGKPEPIAEEVLLRHRPLCQRIMKLLRAG